MERITVSAKQHGGKKDEYGAPIPVELSHSMIEDQCLRLTIDVGDKRKSSVFVDIPYEYLAMISPRSYLQNVGEALEVLSYLNTKEIAKRSFFENLKTREFATSVREIVRGAEAPEDSD